MHLHWERSTNSAGDCVIRDLSWMGKVPEEIPEDEGWKLSRNNYYQEGWLATANVRGVVGVTYTTSFCGGGQSGVQAPARTNYNLRGHRSEVTMVKWNEPYQKLASCDSTGIIFVWIKYEGRWSIELINDRSTPVTSFSWSHDGRMALICYQDGFVLVGSVSGQRYWSSMLPSDTTISCGAWTPDDQQVYVATAEGGLVVMDVHGNIVSKVSLVQDPEPILDLVWNCEKFNMEERDDTTNPFVDNRFNSRACVLAVCFKSGDIKLVSSYDDLSPTLLHTAFQTMYAEWSNSGELLAVAGRVPLTEMTDTSHLNRIKFFSNTGTLISTVLIPFYKSPVTALTWGHNDKRVFVATGPQVHIGWVSRKIASLQLLCRLKIHKTLKTANQVEALPLPCRLKNLLSSLFTHSIKCHIPERRNLRRFVCRPPESGLRLYCTMIRHGGDEVTGSNYTIYLEHLGGFLPILKGRKTSKLKPEFVIFDPLKDVDRPPQASPVVCGGGGDTGSDTETEQEEGGSILYSPRLRRRRRRRRRPQQTHYFGYLGNEEVDYLNTLPEEDKMVEVTSNIWGTKFKIHGLDPGLPSVLGQISYKASLLHLQPRQMRLIVTELKDNMVLVHQTGQTSGRRSSCQLSGRRPSCQLSESEEESEETLDKLTMEDELLTAVTGRLPLPVVAPLPSLPSRLSMADYSRTVNIESETVRQSDWAGLPHVEVTVPQSSPSPPQSCQHLTRSPSEEEKLGLRTTVSSGSDLLTSSDWSVRQNLRGSRSVDQQLVRTVDQQLVDAADPPVSYLRLVRRDSVAGQSSSGSSAASLTSPGRWAAKAEEVKEMDGQPEVNIFPAQRECPRSCSADHLGAIVDILGVPSAAPQFWDNPRRLILSAEKKKAEQRRSLANQGKSRSLDTEEAPKPVTSTPVAPQTLVEACLGGNSAVMESCSACQSAPGQAPELELNREMFSISSPTPEEESDSAPLIQTPRTKRKFDSVRNLLEKARSRLSRSRKNSTSSEVERERCRSHSRELLGSDLGSEPGSPIHLPRSKWREQLCVPDKTSEGGGLCVSQSSPNTPLMARKLRSTRPTRHQSFSPVRALLNSPLLRRKKSSFDSSEEELDSRGLAEHTLFQSRPKPGSCYQNLETFQKQKLRQKLRKLSTLDSGSPPSLDPPTSPHLSNRGRTSSPDLGSPSLSPRFGKELVMHNKAPLWNEGSQVYQLDFGGRVTQESAKNFQIEYLGKQVMQFGRIDANAYTLDFQYPLTAIQAFSVALANVTQRLK